MRLTAACRNSKWSDRALFRKLDRLSKWVLGIYAPQDFQESADPGDAIAQRKKLREDLLRRLVTEEDGTLVQASKWDAHLLEVVFKSEEILEILRKTKAEAALDTNRTQHRDDTANRKDTEDDNVTQQRNETQEQDT